MIGLDGKLRLILFSSHPQLEAGSCGILDISSKRCCATNDTIDQL